MGKFFERKLKMRRKIVLFTIFSLVITSSYCVFAQDGYMGGDQMDSGNMGGYGNMMNSGNGVIIMGIIGILVLVVLVALIYFLLKNSGTDRFGPTSKETPLDILKKRYSRGEITKSQFEEIKKDL